jgi:predicted RNA binding protein YcfA (HicA-like mRNA interferase family)
LPRDISGEELARLLQRWGYQIAWQTGSPMRLTRTAESQHRITIPKHAPLKVGTLNSILKDIAEHLQMSKEQLIRELSGGNR